MRTVLKIGLILSLFGASAPALSQTVEPLYGYLVTPDGITFQVSSGGCTTASSFTVASIDDQIMLLRVEDDGCDAFLPLGIEVSYTWEEIGWNALGSTFVITNPLVTHVSSRTNAQQVAAVDAVDMELTTSEAIFWCDRMPTVGPSDPTCPPASMVGTLTLTNTSTERIELVARSDSGFGWSLLAVASGETVSSGEGLVTEASGVTTLVSCDAPCLGGHTLILSANEERAVAVQVSFDTGVDGPPPGQLALVIEFDSGPTVRSEVFEFQMLITW